MSFQEYNSEIDVLLIPWCSIVLPFTQCYWLDEISVEALVGSSLLYSIIHNERARASICVGAELNVYNFMTIFQLAHQNTNLVC